MHRQRLQDILAAPNIKLDSPCRTHIRLVAPEPHLLEHLAHLARRAFGTRRKAVQDRGVHFFVRPLAPVFHEHIADPHYFVEVAFGA